MCPAEAVRRALEALFAAHGPEAAREAALREIRLAQENGVAVAVRGEEGYPAELLELRDAPPVLYIKGKLGADERRVAMVGTRLPSVGGTRTARDFACGLARAGVTVVSGLARGIDTVSHEGALMDGGRTVAVLGSGILSIYPEENAGLAAQIAQSGALVSEYPLESGPKMWNFPKRNRLIVALSRAVVVVEAPKKSGALITADLALEQGRDVFAVPGSVQAPQARGSNALIQQGAFCAVSPDDVLAGLNWLAIPPAEGEEGAPDDPLLKSLGEAEAMTLEELAEGTGLNAPELMARLTDFELRGLVWRTPDRRYALK